MKRFLFSIALLGLTSTSFATFPQNISSCITVIGKAASAIQVSFASTDVLDFGQKTSVSSGKSCIQHTYQYGPKIINLEIGPIDMGKTKILKDESCGFLNYFRLEKYKTVYSNEHWDFYLQQATWTDKNVFYMSCNHSYS